MSDIIREKVQIKKQMFPKNNSKDGTYRIFKCSPLSCKSKIITDKGYTFSIKGDIPYIDCGETYNMSLLLVDSNQWGGTYDVIEIHDMDNIIDMTQEQKEIILDNITTPQIRKELLNYNTNIIYDILTNGADSIDVSKIYNVKQHRIKSIENRLNEKFKYIQIIQDNSMYNITFEECNKLLNKFVTVNNIKDALNQNPYYVLCDVLQRSYYSYKNNNNSGVDPLLYEKRKDLQHSYIRCEYLILYILRLNEQQGSTKVGLDKLHALVNEYDYTLSNLVSEVIESSLNIYYDNEAWISIYSTYNKELNIATFINYLIHNNIKLDWDWHNFTNIKDGALTEEQQQVLKSVCDNRVVVLDAPSGMGKSATVSAILQMIKHYNKTFSQVSYTGKATKVLGQLTGEQASTIHMLCLNGGCDSDFLIVDEYSFLSIDVLDMLINSIHNKDNIRVIFIGDSHQLPSLQCGDIANDLLSYDKLQKNTLTKCFRYTSSGMTKCGEDCRQGRFYLNENKIINGSLSYGDYTFFQSNNNANQIVDIYVDLLNKYKCNVEDITVITPFNVKELGTVNINNHIQKAINPPKSNEKTLTIKKPYGIITFRNGDLVLNCKNNYSMMLFDSYIQATSGFDDEFESKFVSIMNGDIGKILRVYDDVLKIQFGEYIVAVTKKEIDSLLLAYAISTHKLQGSTLEHSIVITSNQHKNMQSKELLYVALTRAKKSVTEIGDINAIKYSVNTTKANNRQTFLGNLLNKIKDSKYE